MNVKIKINSNIGTTKNININISITKHCAYQSIRMHNLLIASLQKVSKQFSSLSLS